MPKRWCGAEVRVPVSERTPLEPGEFFQSDLIGCEVVDRRTGESLGRGHRLATKAAAPGLLVVDERPADSLRALHLRGDRSGRASASRWNCPKDLKDLNRP